MAKRKTARPRADSPTIEKSLTALGKRLSRSTSRKRGSIHVSLTDSGEEFSVEDVDRDVFVSQGAGASPPLVRITGPASVLQAIVDGRKEASRAFVAGGIQVSGDLDYLEAVLKDLGLLKCE